MMRGKTYWTSASVALFLFPQVSVAVPVFDLSTGGYRIFQGQNLTPENQFTSKLSQLSLSTGLIDFEKGPSGDNIQSFSGRFSAGTYPVTYSIGLPTSAQFEAGVPQLADLSISNTFPITPSTMIQPNAAFDVTAPVTVTFGKPVAAAGLWLLDVDNFVAGNDAFVSWHFTDGSVYTKFLDTNGRTSNDFFGLTTFTDATKNDALDAIEKITFRQLGGNATRFDNVHFGAVTPESLERPVADVGSGPYVFNATTLDLVVDGSQSFDPDGTIDALDWRTDKQGATSIASGITPTIAIEQLGITAPDGKETLYLSVTDDDGINAEDFVEVVYNSATPEILSVNAEEQEDGSLLFQFIVNDEDFSVNSRIAGFEEISVAFDFLPALSSGDLGGSFASAGGIDSDELRQLVMPFVNVKSVFSSNGIYDLYADVYDRSGLFSSKQFQVEITSLSSTNPPSIPEPTTLTIFGLGLAGLGLMRRRKRMVT
jgi:hypothetical protein